MAAEAIPLINALLEAMGLTAAGSAKGKKYDVPEQVSKHASGALDAAAGLASKNPVKVVKGVKTMLTSGKAETPKEAIKEEDELPEDMKKDLADLVNKEFAGFGGEPDDKDNKPKNDKNPPPPAAKPKEMKADSDMKDYNDRLAEARSNRKRWGEEIEVTEDQFMGGSKAAHKAEKMKNMSSPEAVQRSREQFMEGKPNSLDTDKAVSELHGYEKSKIANKPVEQSKTDILEHRRSPEEMRMTNKALPDDKLKKALGLGVSGIIGGIANALPLSGADAYELDEDEMKDFLESVNKYLSSDDENDKAIGRAMMDSFLEDMGLTIDDLITKESGKEPEKKESKKNKDSGIITGNVTEDTDGIIRR